MAAPVTKVALVGPYPVETDKIAGGVAAVTFYLAQGLVQDPEIELHVISPTKLVDEDRTVVEGNLTVHHLAHRRKRLVPNLVRDIGRIRGALRELKPDLVHSQTPGGAIAGAREGLPTVLTIHGINEQELQFARTYSQKLAVLTRIALGRYALRQADRCIAISPYVIECYRGLRGIQWHHIHNPIEDRFYEIESREVRNKMLFAGMVDERKNLPGLIRAFHRIHRSNDAAELFVSGKIRVPSIEAEVTRYIAEHGLQDCVHLLGFVSQEELGRHFAEASLLCVFSNEETSPMIIAQAMCAGKACVSTAAGGVPHLMIDGETGYVVAKGDEAAFADRALALLQDDELRARMGKRGHEVAEEFFRATAVAAKTKAVYLQTLADRRG
ncbi:MAG: glycosyl transferase [Gemmatimonadota bacterium]|nr:MAG: glycosyl transferase [Gemmatimonadota bacterium]